MFTIIFDPFHGDAMADGYAQREAKQAMDYYFAERPDEYIYRIGTEAMLLAIRLEIKRRKGQINPSNFEVIFRNSGTLVLS